MHEMGSSWGILLVRVALQLRLDIQETRHFAHILAAALQQFFNQLAVERPLQPWRERISDVNYQNSYAYAKSVQSGIIKQRSSIHLLQTVTTNELKEKRDMEDWGAPLLHVTCQRGRTWGMLCASGLTWRQRDDKSHLSKDKCPFFYILFPFVGG